MSHHGSVRCSFCGEVGHNRRTCHYLKKQVEEWKSSDDPLVQKRAALFEKTPNKPRKCSFCKQTGHTIRKCPELKAHVQDLTHSWLEAKRFVKDKMFEHNFGVGTLVRMKRRKWNQTDLDYTVSYDLALVTEISYRHIVDKVLTTNAYFRQMTPVKYVFVNGDDAGEQRWGRLPRSIVDAGYKDSDYYAKAEYEKSANDYVIVSSSEASFPDEMLEWDVVWNQAYDFAKGKK